MKRKPAGTRLGLKPDPAIKGIATEINSRISMSISMTWSETRPCYKRDCDSTYLDDPRTKNVRRLKPDPAIKGIATVPSRSECMPTSGLRSETRPCYKRDCDWTTAEPSRYAHVLCLKPDPAIKGIATDQEAYEQKLQMLRLKPDPAIKGIATAPSAPSGGLRTSHH